ncbi:protein kinase [Streptomyces globosus]
MEDYAGRILAGRYRLPLPPSDEYEPAETRAFDTRSGQEVLVRQVPLPEIVDAELVDGEAGGYAAQAPRPPHRSGPGSGPAGELPAVRRAIAAAQAAASVPDHPRLDQVFDVFAEGGSLWIVSELVPARPLAALLAEEPLTPYRAAEVASDVLTALRVLHAHGWTHRNITVRTVLICDDGRVVLTGLAAGAAEDALCGYDPVPPEDDDPPAEDAWGTPAAPAPYAPLIAPGYETTPRPADHTAPDPQLPPGYTPLPAPGPGYTDRAAPERPQPPGGDPLGGPAPAAGPRYADRVVLGLPSPSGGDPSAAPGSPDGPRYADGAARQPQPQSSGSDPLAEPGSAAGPRYADHVVPERSSPLPSAGDPPGVAGPVAGPRYADHIVPERDPQGAGPHGGGAAGEGGLPAADAAGRAPLVAPGYETGPRGGAVGGSSRAVAAHGVGPEAVTSRVAAGEAPGAAPERRPIGSKVPQGYSYPYGGPKAAEDAPPAEAPAAPTAPAPPAPAQAPPGRSRGGPAGDALPAGADVPWHGATPRRQAALPPALPQGYRHADDDTAPRPAYAGGPIPAGLPHAPGGPAGAEGPGGDGSAARPVAPGGPGGPVPARLPRVPGSRAGAEAPRGDRPASRPAPAGGPGGPVPARLPHAPAGPAGSIPAGLPDGPGAPAAAAASRGERPGPWAAQGGGPAGTVPARLPGAPAAPAGPGGPGGAVRARLLGAPAAPADRPDGGAPAAAGGPGGGRPAPGAAAPRGPRAGLDAERARQTRMAVVGAVTERWAPEQARTVAGPWQIAAPVGPATDLWALGALLYRAVQGHPPYPEDSAAELVEMVCAEPPAFAEECGPLRPVVESLLRQDPTERPDFEELRGWLRSLVRSAPEPDAAPGALPPAEPDPARLPAVRRRGDLHGRHRNPAPRRGPRRLGPVLLAGVLALTAGAVAYAVLFLPRAGEGQDRDAVSQAPVAKTETPSPQAPRSPSAPAPSGTPGPSQPAPQAPASAPPGYTVQQDPEHFEIAVPQGWERRGMNEAGQVRYTDGQYVLIVVPGRDKVEGSPDPATYQKDKEPELAPYRSSTWASGGDVKTTKVGQQLRATGRYTWIDGTGRSVVARNFVVALGGSYHVVMVTGPQDGEGKVTEVFEKATGSYKSGG